MLKSQTDPDSSVLGHTTISYLRKYVFFKEHKRMIPGEYARRYWNGSSPCNSWATAFHFACSRSASFSPISARHFSCLLSL